MRIFFDWRAAHHWLRGYSDAEACRPAHPQNEKYADHYHRGYEIGRHQGVPCQA